MKNIKNVSSVAVATAFVNLNHRLERERLLAETLTHLELSQKNLADSIRSMTEAPQTQNDQIMATIYNSNLETMVNSKSLILDLISLLKQLKPDWATGSNDFYEGLRLAIDASEKIVENYDKFLAIVNRGLPNSNGLVEFTKSIIMNPLAESFNCLDSIYSSFTTPQLILYVHLSGLVLVIICFISILFIIYGDYLINYFKLEDRYPTLGKYIKFKKVFKQYYLFKNFFIIIVTLLAIIYLDLSMFI